MTGRKTSARARYGNGFTETFNVNNLDQLTSLSRNTNTMLLTGALTGSGTGCLNGRYVTVGTESDFAATVPLQDGLNIYMATWSFRNGIG